MKIAIKFLVCLLFLGFNINNCCIAQNFNNLVLEIDSLNVELVDSSQVIDGDYKLIIAVVNVERTKKKEIRIRIEDSKFRSVNKQYDYQTKTLLGLISQVRISNIEYLDGKFYYYSMDSKTSQTGKYKKNILSGKVITRDSLGRVIFCANCNPSKNECNVTAYYEDGSIKSKCRMYNYTLYDGNYSEYYKNGKLKVKGKYKLYKSNNMNTFNYYNDTLIDSQKLFSDFNHCLFSVRIGRWMYYDENEYIEKIDTYDYNGGLKSSMQIPK